MRSGGGIIDPVPRGSSRRVDRLPDELVPDRDRIWRGDARLHATRPPRRRRNRLAARGSIAQKQVCSQTQSNAPRRGAGQLEEIRQFVAFTASSGEGARRGNRARGDIDPDDLFRARRQRADIVSQAAARHQHRAGDRLRGEKIDEAGAGRAFVPRRLTALVLVFPISGHGEGCWRGAWTEWTSWTRDWWTSGDARPMISIVAARGWLAPRSIEICGRAPGLGTGDP